MAESEEHSGRRDSERIVRLEVTLAGVKESLDKLPGRFDKLENDYRNAAREDRAQHDLAMAKMQESFIVLFKDDRERHKEQLDQMRKIYDEKFNEIKPIQRWVIMAMGAIAVVVVFGKTMLDKFLK